MKSSVNASTHLIANSHRLVHLDLKGAPPKISYLRQLFPILRENGATGLLIEYEDTFPYEASLQHLSKQPDVLPVSKTAETTPTSVVSPSALVSTALLSHQSSNTTGSSAQQPTAASVQETQNQQYGTCEMLDSVGDVEFHLRTETSDEATNNKSSLNAALTAQNSNATPEYTSGNDATMADVTSSASSKLSEANLVANAIGAEVTTTTTSAQSLASPPFSIISMTTDALQSSARPPHYSRQEIEELLSCAAANDLIVIPLHQTFGHLEFVLKHSAHHNLRESMQHPNAICPRHPDTLPLLQLCLQQLMALHPRVSYLHLGMDEVLVGACERCKVSSRERVYLEWAVMLCGWVKRTYPHVTPIIWDDMIRTIPLHHLKASGIGAVTDLMIWKYEAGPLSFPDGYLIRVWQIFNNSGTNTANNSSNTKNANTVSSSDCISSTRNDGGSFSSGANSIGDTERSTGSRTKISSNNGGGGIWIASAYKGATGAAQCLVPAQHHIDNHIAWLNLVKEHGDNIQSFRGVALTGWQRYDHMSILCELLPASVPCLLLCLRVLAAQEFTQPLHASVSRKLGFPQLINLSTTMRPQVVEENLNFPGHELYTSLQLWTNFRATYSAHSYSEIVSGWYHHYRRKQRFLAPGILEMVRPQCIRMLQSATELMNRLKENLMMVYDVHTTKEWIECFVLPLRNKIARQLQECQELSRYDTAICDSKTCSCSAHYNINK